MAETFRCTDRWGRLIVLREDRWETHIILRHPEFRGGQTIVETILTDPAFVNYDRSRRDREVFYRPSPLPEPFGGLYVRVVVEFRAAGEVVTAHLIVEPHRKETRKWP